MKRERRFLQSEVKVEAGESPKITGYAAVFGKKSHDLGNFVEVIDAGAFAECLAGNPDIIGCINHSDDLVLGRTGSGTMRVSTDDIGMKYEIDPPETSYAKDLMVSMARGDINASSFAFYALKEKWSIDPSTNQNVRTILKATVCDCSVVTNPAYPDASSQLRSLFPDDKGHVPESIMTHITELRTNTRKEKRFKNILAAVASTRWAILPEKLETICALLNSRAAGVAASKEEIQAAMMGSESGGDVVFGQGVAVIPMYGTVSQRMNLMSEFSGGTSVEKLTAQFRGALADDSVSSIVFDIDSPGGTVTGVPELAAEILASRGKKPIIAVANGMAASAAYWLASAADKLVVIPSGEVGSIGVYCTHQDVSGAMDKAGVSISYIQAGKFKTEGNPYEPLSDEARADMQKGVDDFYEMFVAGVAEGRGVTADVVKADFGQGRMFLAKDALANGMADQVATLDQVIAGLSEVAVAEVTEVSEVEVPTEGFVSPSEASVVAGTGCMCDCSSCKTGDCSACLDEDCDDDNCIGCGDDDGDGDEEGELSSTDPVVAELSAGPALAVKPVVEVASNEAGENERIAYLLKFHQLAT